jgi:alkanesulfonate monooxygenase SsuD/methylene tetrahydromethanopterin reductase-like flavin-dependent oxidoreductase (luciferase family)
VPVKVLLQTAPHGGTPEEIAEQRPLGRQRYTFHTMLQRLVRAAKAADELGYWGMAHAEHHFHSEAIEYCPNPGLMAMYLGQHTKRLMHGELGYVVPARDPLRLAEEIAMIDHMLSGRTFVGMARGYQSRWTNVLGQHYHVTSTTSDQGELDRRNKELFFEHYELMKKAWTQDYFTHDTEHYKVPFPADGLRNWPAAEVTRKYGTPGEVDDEGTLKHISVVPRPYQEPHPQLFQAFSVSESTLRWCGEEGITPTILWSDIAKVENLMRAYYEASAAAGRHYEWGQNVGIVRGFHITDSSDVADAVGEHEGFIWTNWFNYFGFTEALRYPDEADGTPIPAPGETIGERLMKSGMFMAGSVDDVKRQVEQMLDRAPVEYLIWLGDFTSDNGMRQLELFAKHIMPEFDMQVTTEPAGQ